MVREWEHLGGYYEVTSHHSEDGNDDGSSKLLELITKKCTSCGMRLTKNGGCIHFTCQESAGGCGHEFCWVCSESWPTKYDCTISKCKKPKARTAVQRQKDAFRDANEDCSFNAYAGRYAADALSKFTALVDTLRLDDAQAITRDVQRYLELLRSLCLAVKRSR